MKIIYCLFLVVFVGCAVPEIIHDISPTDEYYSPPVVPLTTNKMMLPPVEYSCEKSLDISSDL